MTSIQSNTEYDYNTTTIQMGFRRKSNDLFESVSQTKTLTLSRSRSSWDHHLNKLGRPHILMLHTKSQGHWPSGFGEDFLGVFTI